MGFKLRSEFIYRIKNIKNINDKLRAIKTERLSPDQAEVLAPLLNIIEDLFFALTELQDENQRLRNETNRLKVVQGKPDKKPNKTKTEQTRGGYTHGIGAENKSNKKSETTVSSNNNTLHRQIEIATRRSF